MSGGSFNYLCNRFGTAEEYEAIATALAESGHGRSKALRDIYDLVVNLRSCEELARKLEPVLHGIEWTVSCDWGPDQLKAAVEEYEKRHA